MLRNSLGVVALALLLFAAAARADTVFESDTFSVQSGAFGAGLVDLLPFDDSLGTLTKVSVELSGLITASVRAPLSVDSYGTPYPTLITAEVRHDFDRLANQYFEFSGPATTRFQTIAPSAGQPVTLVSPFRYSFAFDATTDLTGGLAFPSVGYGATPPFSVQALLADFLPKGPADLNQILLRQELVSLGGGAVPISLNTTGSLRVDYHFDRTEPPSDPPPVPEPGTLALTLCGAACIVGWRRSRSRRTCGNRNR